MILFVCQISDTELKIVKYQPIRGRSGKVIAQISEPISTQDVTQQLIFALSKLGYKRQRIIFVLPRNKATSRILSIPAQDQREIERIANLQATRFLPYPPEELITAHQVISRDPTGVSEINLIIVHREIIEQYTQTAKDAGTRDFQIILSSFGLMQWYIQNSQSDKNKVMIIDANTGHAEIIITLNSKLLFSRSFKTPHSGMSGALLLEEIQKTLDTYIKESGQAKPEKIVIVGNPNLTKEFHSALSNRMAMPVDIFTAAKPQEAEFQIAALLGAGMLSEESSLNLLASLSKEKQHSSMRQREFLNITGYAIGILAVLGLSVYINTQKKISYLAKLKAQANSLSAQALPIEEIEIRLKILQQKSIHQNSLLDIISQLHKLLPSAVSLTNFAYSAGDKIIMRGQANELNVVFSFAESLEKSPAFNGFQAKVRYATKKNTPAGEIIEFEIVCAKQGRAE